MTRLDERLLSVCETAGKSDDEVVSALATVFLQVIVKNVSAKLAASTKAEAHAIKKEDEEPVESLLCGVKAGAKMIGRSERFIADAIARGKIRAVKSDRRTLLVVQSIWDYAASLPSARGTLINPRRRTA